MKKKVLLVCALFYLLGQGAFAATLMVPADYGTIQAAVDAAETGDTIIVGDGVYSGRGNCNIVVSKSIKVISGNGPEHTIIDCPEGQHGFRLDLSATACPQIFPDEFRPTSLQEGVEYYSDRNHTLTGVPPAYLGMHMIALPNNDRERTDPADYLILGAYCDLVVYVAYDSRAATLPQWMSGFSDTGDYLNTSQGGQAGLKIYSRRYADGECVNLGANKAAGFSGDEIDAYVFFYTEDVTCTGVALEGLQIRNAVFAVAAYGPSPLASPVTEGTSFAIKNCRLTDNRAGVTAFGSTGSIDDCRFTGNAVAVSLDYALLEIQDCLIRNNGAGLRVSNGSITVNRSTISGNANEGVEVVESGINIYNSIISGNGFYGLLFDFVLYADIFHTTVYRNNGGLFIGWDAEVDITNSIFRENGLHEIEIDPDSSVHIRNTNLAGGVSGIIGGGAVNDQGGNIDADPLFKDPDGPDGISGTEDDDLHLASASPCIDAGTADLPSAGFEFDIDLEPRTAGAAPDMGADELHLLTIYFRDRDGDGYGDSRAAKPAISPPTGYVADSSDCNDDNAAVNPGAEEICNGIDDNCDGRIDEPCADDTPITPVAPGRNVETSQGCFIGSLYNLRK